MKALVVYDSVFGNTERVAQAMGEALASQGEVAVVKVTDARPEHLSGVDLLLVGSPTRAFRPTPALMGWIKALPAGALSGVRVAGFDTRISTEDANSAILRFFVRLFGWAAPDIDKGLVRKGGVQAAPPEGFYVAASEGPLKPGELERSTAWAQRIGAAR